MNRNVRLAVMTLVTAAAFILPFVVYGMTSFAASGQALDRKNEQIIRTTANVAFLHAAQHHRDNVKKDLPLMEAELVKQSSALPAQPSAEGLRTDVDALLQRCGCKLLKFEPRKSFVIGPLRILPVRVELEGPRDALPGIVRDLEASPALTTIEGALIKPVDDKRAQLWLVADRYGVIERFGIIAN